MFSINDKAYITGGSDFWNPGYRLPPDYKQYSNPTSISFYSHDNYEYSFESDSYNNRQDFPVSMNSVSNHVMENGKAYVFGGWKGYRTVYYNWYTEPVKSYGSWWEDAQKSHKKYDAEGDSWLSEQEMTFEQSQKVQFSWGNKCYALGGVTHYGGIGKCVHPYIYTDSLQLDQDPVFGTIVNSWAECGSLIQYDINTESWNFKSGSLNDYYASWIPGTTPPGWPPGPYFDHPYKYATSNRSTYGAGGGWDYDGYFYQYSIDKEAGWPDEGGCIKWDSESESYSLLVGSPNYGIGPSMVGAVV
jgi:hypothetical protein